MLVSDDGQRFAFDKRELAVLTSMMAGDDRETLAALWFHPSKAQAWATDGHRAVMVDRDDKPPKAPATAKPVGIPAATAHHAAKTAGRRDLVVIDISGKRVAIDIREPTTKGAELTSFEQIDGQTRSKHAVTCARHRAEGIGSIENFFPAHHGRGSKGAAVPINPALLAPVMLLAKIAEPKGQTWINLGKPHEPVVLVARSDQWTVWRMLVMPLRATPDEHPDHGRQAKAGKKSKAGTTAEPSPADATSIKSESSRGAEPTPAKGRGRRAPARDHVHA